MRMGPNYLGNGICELVVWALLLKDGELKVVSLSDPDLVEAARKGKKEEFKTFNWKGGST